MTVIVDNLIPAQAMAASPTAYYTVPAGTRVILDKITATNTSGIPAIVSLFIPNSGDGASTANTITSSKTIGAGVAYLFPEAVGHVLTAGQYIALNSTSSAVSLRASGRIVT